MNSDWERFDDGDVRDLLAEYPLAWLVARVGGGASLLPLLGEYDAEGRLVSLIGHMGRRNPLHAQLAAHPAATILVNGPQGYISIAQAGRRDWGPTWNYAQLTIAADVVFLPDDDLHRALDMLVARMEGDGWTSAELGPRYDGMAKAIIAFRATVTSLAGRFKLGQDESLPVFASIVSHHPDTAMVRWMRRFAR